VQSIDNQGNNQEAVTYEIGLGKMDETCTRAFSTQTKGLALTLDASLSLLSRNRKKNQFAGCDIFL